MVLRSRFIEMIHSDLWTPAPVLSIQKYSDYVLVIGDCSCFSWIFPLTKKSKFFFISIKFQRMIGTRFPTKVEAFQSRGGEFSSAEFLNHLNTGRSY